MNKTFSRVLACICLVVNITSCKSCKMDTVTTDFVETKTGVFKHNYIGISASDNSSQEVFVSYSIKGNDGNNILIEDTLKTPVLIGGEDVMVTYDSLVSHYGDRYVDSRLELERDYTVDGSEYLVIKNLSSVSLEYCIIGNQPLSFKSKVSYEFKNEHLIDMKCVIHGSPVPVYEMAPILYLLKPELALERICYIPMVKGNAKRIDYYYAGEVPMFSDRVGNITAGLPFTIEQVMKIYREEHLNSGYSIQKLFYSYYDYHDKQIVVDENHISLQSGLESGYPKLYGTIAAGQTLTNSQAQKICFINIPYHSIEYGYKVSYDIDGDRF